jgi:hypothetical protein
MDISWKFHDGQQVFSMIKMRSVVESVFLRTATASFGVLVVVLLVITIFRLRKSNGKGGNRG